MKPKLNFAKDCRFKFHTQTSVMTVDAPQTTTPGLEQPVYVTKVPPPIAPEPEFTFQKPNGPHFQCKSSIAIWFYLIFFSAIGFCLGLGIFVTVTTGTLAGLFVLVEVIVLILIIVLIPKRLEVWNDSVKVCFFYV